LQPGSGEALSLLFVSGNESAEDAASAILEVQHSRRTRPRVLVQPHLQTNLAARCDLRKSRKGCCKASNSMSEIDVVCLSLADDYRCRRRVERAVEQELAIDLLSRRLPAWSRIRGLVLVQRLNAVDESQHAVELV